jgi:ankyrin repeat protein
MGDLREAAARGDLPFVEQLLEAGVNPKAAAEIFAEWNPLMYAAAGGYLGVVEVLLMNGAVADTVDRDGTTAVMQAGYWGHADVVDLLVQSAADSALAKRSVPKAVVPSDASAGVEWAADGSVVVLCSAPEFERDGSCVMIGLEELCRMFPDLVKFGYE